MDFSKFLQDMKDARKDDPVFQLAKLQAQKTKEANNPQVAGPPIPDDLPQEKEYYDNMIGAVSGSMSPVAGKVLSEAEQLAVGQKNALSELAKSVTGPNVEAMPTQIASRALDFAQRNADQLKARRAAMFKK